MKHTYADVIKMLEQDGKLFVAVFYPNHTSKSPHYGWLPVDKAEYLRQLRLILDPAGVDFPCYFEVEPDGDMFIHPKMESRGA